MNTEGPFIVRRSFTSMADMAGTKALAEDGGADNGEGFPAVRVAHGFFVA
jgi:hypothetical protein